MSSTARYLPRSPRYVFRPLDEKLLRFAGPRKNSDSHHAEIRDLSATGLSFVTDASQAPKLGDLLKVEFQLPEKARVAWFAEVVRVEAFSEWTPTDQIDSSRSTCIVALRFHKMTPAMTSAMNKSLKPHLRPVDEGVVELKQITTGQRIFLFAMGTVVLLCLILMSMPLDLLLKLANQ